MSFQALSLIRKEVKAGSVTEKCYSNLSLFKYSNKCVYDNLWNSINKRCRGIIFNTRTGAVVARGFDKFFNLGEKSETEEKLILKKTGHVPFRVTEKMDGSLCLTFKSDGMWLTSTPGSMESEQAIYARNVLLEKYDLSRIPDDVTLVCEFISPTDRKDKVVDYGNMDELILLTAFENKWDQTEVPCNRVALFAKNAGMKLVPVWSVGPETITKIDIPNNTEGYVIAFQDGLRVKVKSLAYVKAHRLIADFSGKHIIDYIKDGSYRGAVQQLPEPKRVYFDDFYAQVLSLKGTIELEAEEWAKQCDPNDMKATSETLKNAPRNIRPLVFGIVRHKPMEDYLWKLVVERFKETLER